MRVDAVVREQLPALAVLFEELSGLPTARDRLAAVFATMAEDPDYHLLGATEGATLAGALLGVVCLDCVGDCRPFMVVENVIVAAPFRRRGVGRLLLEEIERRARLRDCFYVMLTSGRDRTDAHAFYGALGYAATAGFKKRLERGPGSYSQ
jgi:phosphoglycolate phosphatase